MHDDALAVEIDTRDSHTVVALRGEIDRINAAEVREMLVQADGADPLIVDLSHTRYLDSAGIAMLEGVVSARPTRLVVPTDTLVRRALETTGLLALWATFERVQDALGPVDN